MPLVCRETEKGFPRGKKDYVVMHPIVKVGFAVTSDIIDRIPRPNTYADPCRRYGEGLNIHEVSGSVGRVSVEGYYKVFVPGKFTFAIMRSVAQAHLPKVLAIIDQEAERRTES